jgi:hypothetical protein
MSTPESSQPRFESNIYQLKSLPPAHWPPSIQKSIDQQRSLPTRAGQSALFCTLLPFCGAMELRVFAATLYNSVTLGRPDIRLMSPYYQLVSISEQTWNSSLLCSPLLQCNDERRAVLIHILLHGVRCMPHDLLSRCPVAPIAALSPKWKQNPHECVRGQIFP